MIHEYNDNSDHKIVTAGNVSGKWYHYTEPAFLQVEEAVYMAVTEYFAGGMLEPDVIYKAVRA